VFARECRRCGAPHECGSNSRDFVGRHLLAVPTATEDDSDCVDAREFVTSNAECGVDAKAGVIIERVELDRSVVDDLVARSAAVFRNNPTQFHAGVIGCEVDAHE
jgi:hypothetical protein